MSGIVGALSAGTIAAFLAGGAALVDTSAAAAPPSGAERAALKKAATDCNARVREKGKYEEMSWYARRRFVKNCIKETLAGRR
jgi:hypothetical protein